MSIFVNYKLYPLQLFKLMMENLNVNRHAEGRDLKKILLVVIQPQLMNTAVKVFFILKINLVLKIIPQMLSNFYNI